MSTDRRRHRQILAKTSKRKIIYELEEEIIDIEEETKSRKKKTLLNLSGIARYKKNCNSPHWLESSFHENETETIDLQSVEDIEPYASDDSEESEKQESHDDSNICVDETPQKLTPDWEIATDESNQQFCLEETPIILESPVSLYSNFKIHSKEIEICDDSEGSQIKLDERFSQFLSPVISSSPEVADCSPRKGSRWLNHVRWQPKTPTKSDLTPTSPDTSKKKSKFLKNGFAEQLQKLEASEKSLFNIWLHKKESLSKKIKSQCLIFHIHKYQTVGELALIFGRALKVPENINSANSQYCEGENLIVILPLKHHKTSELKNKDVLRIYPPWNLLRTSCGHKVLLSAYNYELHNTGNVINETDVESQKSLKLSTWQWICPCKEGDLNPTECPAITEPSKFLFNVTIPNQFSQFSNFAANSFEDS